MGSRHRKGSRADKRPRPSAGVLPSSQSRQLSKASKHHRHPGGSITIAARKKVAKDVRSGQSLAPDVSNSDYWAFSYMPNVVTVIEGTSQAKLDMAALGNGGLQ